VYVCECGEGRYLWEGEGERRRLRWGNMVDGHHITI
jgi:hypothetical protein